MVGIGIFDLAIESLMLYRCMVVKWLRVIQQPILEFNKYIVKKFILIVSEHRATNVSLLQFLSKTSV